MRDNSSLLEAQSKYGPWHIAREESFSGMTWCGKKMRYLGLQHREATEAPEGKACTECASRQSDNRPAAWKRR
jgi:hypothetical protein